MNTKVKTKNKRIIKVEIDPRMDKYDHIVLFPSKMKLADEKLTKSGLPNFQSKKQKSN